jgi:tol-pal system protein YbgF
MKKQFICSINRVILILSLSLFAGNLLAEDSPSNSNPTVLEQLQILQQDIKTLEKAVYSNSVETSSITSSSSSNNSKELSGDENDVLTKHLLKLSELEEQFKILSNNFEEINFKLDKISGRITKIQTDNQVRFQDLESGETNIAKKNSGTKKKLPGSSEATDLGGITDADLLSTEQVQKTQSVESAGTIITEEAERTEKILPAGSPEEQYKFAVSFIQVGDYETAEIALREFVDDNEQHKLAGNAQYWYGETFRVRQLYQDAATAYLNGYQKYPKSTKAPVNLLKLGVMLVQIGEKEQGCSMIIGVKEQYPKANQSVIQKAEHEKKKFNCGKKS